jgi:hypothetical protein
MIFKNRSGRRLIFYFFKFMFIPYFNFEIIKILRGTFLTGTVRSRATRLVPDHPLTAALEGGRVEQRATCI